MDKTAPARPHRLNPRHWHWRRKLLAAVLLLLLTLLTIGLIRDALNPIPYAARRGITFPLYYPKQLPAGYSVDNSSFHQTDQVVIFSIQAPNNKNIAVSQQHLPSDLDLSTRKNPAGITLPDERTFTTPLGPAHMSLWGDKTVVSLPVQETWLILNVTGIAPRDVEKVTAGLKQL